MNADRLAPWYRWVEYAAFGGTLEHARSAHLAELARARRILVLGEGDGRALRQMLAAAPNAHFDVIEQSAAMVALAQKRCDSPGRVHFLNADLRLTPFPAPTYDAIISFFVLDCLNPAQCRDFISRATCALAPGGTWLVCEFTVPPSGWRAWHARIWIAVMYRFFRLATGLQTRAIPPYPDYFQEFGLSRAEILHWRWGLVASEVWRRKPQAGT